MALPTGFVELANQRHKDSKTFFMNWKGEARDDFAFIAGKQWADKDIQKLEDEERPAVTFNYSEKMVDAVVGAEVSNRQEVTYKPRETTDAAVAEVWNNAAKWVRDSCNAEDEESDSFRDALICGMGWTQTQMSYEEELDGMIEINRRDPLSMLWDPAAVKPGLVDRRYNFFDWWVDKREAHKEWPTTFVFASSEPETISEGVTVRGQAYNQETYDEAGQHKDQVLISLYECVEREVVYRVPRGEQLTELTPAEFNAVKDELEASGIDYVKQYRKVYYRAYFAGDTLLEGGISPCQTGFTFNCVTAKRDRNKNTWYGLTRVMKDPQRWANKWLSQILHIVNSNAKGGLMAEIGAFVDPTKAQEEWSKADSVTLLNEGGLGKVEQKTMSSYPQGLDRLMNFALQSLPMVTGINLEALGLANREQAGVLEQQRKQAAYGLLSPLFDSLRRYRKVQGKVLLEFINKYISDGRMVRIGGMESEKFVPLTKQPGAMRYDVFVDQSPNAPDVKDKTWQTLGTIIPAMMKAGIPIPPDLLDYTPLPVALTMKWKKFIEEQEEQRKKQQISPEQLQQLTQELEKTKAALADKTADMAVEERKAQHEMSLKERTFQRDSQLRIAELRAKLALQQQELQNKKELDQQTANADVSARMSEIVEGGANAATERINNTINTLVDAISKLTTSDED